jgi:restriction system protein
MIEGRHAPKDPGPEICLDPIELGGLKLVPIVSAAGEYRFEPFPDPPSGRPAKGPALVVSGIILGPKVSFGVLLSSVGVAWSAVVRKIGSNWSDAYKIPAVTWEELIAGAFDHAGFDDVILTPRSGDCGRDVIAIKKGVGCIKVIIGSVKAYAPGNLVRHDDVRALLGVLNGERDASKAILMTAPDFAPRIRSDPFIEPYLLMRLELLNGKELSEWLVRLAK